MSTRSALLNAIKAFMPLVKSKAKTWVYGFVKVQLRALIISFVKSLERHPVMRDVDLPEDQIADFIIDVLEGKTLSHNDKQKAEQILSVLRAGFYK